MVPILYLAGVIIVATVVLASGFRHSWATAIFGSAIGTLTGTLLGSLVGIVIDSVQNEGDAFFPASATGAALGAIVAIVMIASQDRKQ